MNRDAAVRLVNGWIDRYRLYLKDGGGAAGVHHVAKEALINDIAAVLESVPIPVEPPKLRGTPAKKARAKALGDAGKKKVEDVE